MEPWVGLAILLLLAVPLALAISRANELFCLEVRAGAPRLVRGRIPQRLLNDLADVLARPRVDHARLRAVVEDGRARLLVATGSLPESQLQRLRNVLGTYRVQEIRAGAKPKR